MNAPNRASAKQPREDCRRLEVGFIAPFFYRNSKSPSSFKRLETIMASMAQRRFLLRLWSLDCSDV
jgi:hypothetical protein